MEKPGILTATLVGFFCAVLWTAPLKAQQANPGDVSSIDAIMLATYDVISGQVSSTGRLFTVGDQG